MVCVQVSMYEKIVLCVMLAIGGSYGIAGGAFRLWLETGGHYQRDRSESRGRAERRWRPAREGAAQSTRQTPSRDRGVPPGAVRDERGAGSSGDPQGFSRSGGEADKYGPPIREDHCAFPVRRRPAAHTGNARISYILGYRSKRLSQVNIIWTSDGTTTGDETVVGIAKVPSRFVLEFDWRGLQLDEDTWSGSKVNRLSGEFLGQALPSIDFAHCDLT
jgi:hypothetical protein